MYDLIEETWKKKGGFSSFNKIRKVENTSCYFAQSDILNENGEIFSATYIDILYKIRKCSIHFD